MTDPEALARQIVSIGFECIRCGSCCRPSEGVDSNLVLVFCGEIRSIIRRYGLSWDAVAEPFPVFMTGTNGSRYTLGWSIRRNAFSCAFHEESRCRIYPCRPWICKTYPFVLRENMLETHPCPGLGRTISPHAALRLALDLFERQETERMQDNKIRALMEDCEIPSGIRVVVDDEGIKKI